MDSLLRFARMNSITSGVSPMITMLLLFLALFSWLYAQLRRRAVGNRGRQEGIRRPCCSEGYWGTICDIIDQRRRYEEALSTPWPWVLARQVSWAYSVVVLVYGFYFLSPAVFRFSAVALGDYSSMDGPVFELSFQAFYLVLLALLVYHAFRLMILWNWLHSLMKTVLRLPLLHALDRMPLRVARWFFEPANGNHDRDELIDQQVTALKALHDEQWWSEFSTFRAAPGRLEMARAHKTATS